MIILNRTLLLACLDASPIISYPHTLTEITPELSLSYQQEVTCVATGYPPPTVLWYDSDNDVVTTGDTLLLQTTNVYDGAVYTCKAENIFGGDAGSILISIDITDISVTDIFDNIDDNFGNPSGFDPEQVDDIAVLVSNILPNISSIPISEINDTKDTLAKGADTIEMLFDVISDNGTAISLDDAGTIVNTAGDIINKDTELEDISDNPSLSPEAIQQVNTRVTVGIPIHIPFPQNFCRNPHGDPHIYPHMDIHMGYPYVDPHTHGNPGKYTKL